MQYLSYLAPNNKMIKTIKWLFVLGMLSYCIVSTLVLLYEGIPQKYLGLYFKHTPSYNGVDTLTPQMKAVVKELEDKIGKVTITSGARNGKGTSAHNAGLAVDLRAWDGKTKYAIVNAALELGIKRVGIYDRHVHIDIDSTKTHQNTIWLGKSK